MSNQNLNMPETLVKGMQNLIRDERYAEAKELADKLFYNGYPKEKICYACWPYMERLIKINMKKAEEFSSIFKEYNFHYWLKLQSKSI